MLSLNPVVLLIILYLTVNFLSMLIGCFSGEIQVETSFFHVSPESLVYSFILQCCCLFVLYVIYSFFLAKSKNVNLKLKNKWGILLCILQISFAIFNYTMGVNLAGSTERIEGGSFMNYFFIFFQPDNLFVIISLCLKSPMLFWINIIIYTISMLLRGWMGGVFIMFFLIISRFQHIKISIRLLIKLFSFLIILLVLMPVIIEAKWAMRTGVPIIAFINAIPSYFSVDRYLAGASYLLNRFQHVGHLALILENATVLNSDYMSARFSSYFWDGLPQTVLSKTYNIEIVKLTSYIVEFIFGVPNPSWNVNVGIVGWFFILKWESIVLILYLFCLLFFPYYIVCKYSGKKVLTILSCFSIVYLFHGWFGAYINLALFACLVSILANIKVHKSV